MRRVIGAGLLALILSGCDGNGDSTGPSVVFTGDYQGVERANFGTTSLRASLVQSGSSVTGSYSNGVGDAGTATGTVSGSNFTGSLRSTRIAGLSCDVNAALSSGGAHLDGTFACNDGTQGSFTLDRV